MDLLQYIAVALLVGVSAGYVALNLYRGLAGSGSGACGGSCCSAGKQRAANVQRITKR